MSLPVLQTIEVAKGPGRENIIQIRFSNGRGFVSGPINGNGFEVAEALMRLGQVIGTDEHLEDGSGKDCPHIVGPGKCDKCHLHRVCHRER